MAGLKNPDGDLTDSRGKFPDLGVFFLRGSLLSGVAFLAPDAGHRLGAFFKLAAQTSWRVPLQAQPAWCSLKIILISLGLLFLLDAAGTGLARLGWPRFALLAFAFQALKACLFLTGGFFHQSIALTGPAGREANFRKPPAPAKLRRLVIQCH